MILIIFCAVILFSSKNITVYAKQSFIQHETYTDITPYSNNYEWRYKVENGKMYRRLYDNRNGCWIGGWEL